MLSFTGLSVEDDGVDSVGISVTGNLIVLGVLLFSLLGINTSSMEG